MAGLNPLLFSTRRCLPPAAGTPSSNDFVCNNLQLLLLNAQELHHDKVGQPADGVAKEGDAS
jgi:hypothetical protein